MIMHIRPDEALALGAVLLAVGLAVGKWIGRKLK